ncbi:MAG: HEPN domain-containing protein [Eubacterium sp.]|nr:HEPN domain-containing protein [Eubacterium sp.]
MPEQIPYELSALQLSRAKETLTYIPTMIDIGDYNTAINRAYYAAFHAIKALEILDNYDSKKHSGVIAYFRQQYVKTEKLDVSLSKIIDVLQTRREDSDYNMIIKFDSGDAYDALEKARIFVSAVEEYLKSDK